MYLLDELDVGMETLLPLLQSFAPTGRAHIFVAIVSARLRLAVGGTWSAEGRLMSSFRCKMFAQLSLVTFPFIDVVIVHPRDGRRVAPIPFFSPLNFRQRVRGEDH